MKSVSRIALWLSLLFLIPAFSNIKAIDNEPPELDNPITADYIRKNLSKNHPRLILTPEIEKDLKKKLKSDPLVLAYYQYLQNEATKTLEEPLLKRELTGFRLLSVSRRMAERMGVLCMVYRMDKDPVILTRINDELQAVCAFSDWNPQHFLDIAEMSFAVALALDWVGNALPDQTVDVAKSSLIEKGLKPSFNETGTRMFWINSSNNWNAVCHGGMIAASLAIAEKDPELAARTISRALEKLPGSLKEYGPDGIYPEGPGYWVYGTSYSVLASEMLNTALGSDFGISKSPGFLKSANFRLLATAPSGEYFNFADSDGRKGGSGSVLLTWFAAQTGDEIYLDKPFLEAPLKAGRLAGPGLVWLSQFEQTGKSELPLQWFGKGRNPLAFFRGEKEDAGQFYLAVKGGSANISHGNMDAGTFIFELNGVRWVIDPGNQPYYPLNRIGFNLAGHCQDCPRWTLLTKRNTGHSTITVNNARFIVKAHAPIIDFKTVEKPEVTIDMTEIFGDNLTSLQRRFIKESNSSFMIEDKFELNDSTRTITWALMTVARVIPIKNGAILKQDGKELNLSILAPGELEVSVISLDPPPLEIDKTIKNLKRTEIMMPAYIFPDGKGMIRVQVSGE